MERGFARLSALTQQNATPSLLLRATRIWETLNQKNGLALRTNVVFLDQEGTQIVGVIGAAQNTESFPVITEGTVYQISNAMVVGAPKLFRPVDNNMSLMLHHGTRIEQTEDTRLIPRHMFELKSLEDAELLINEPGSLIDVVGLIIQRGPLERAAYDAKKMDITLANERGKKMGITLWDDRAYQLLDAFEGTEGPPFAVVAGLLAKKNGDNTILSSTAATRSYLNIDYTPLIELQRTMGVATPKTIQLIETPTVWNTLATRIDGWHTLTVRQILDYYLPAGKKAALCLCRAEICALVDGFDSLITGCLDCGRKVRPIHQGYYCYTCATDYTETKQRFTVRVRDHSGATTFTLFAPEVKQLISAHPENDTPHGSQGTNLSDRIITLKDIVPGVLLFHVKVRPCNTNLGYEDYTVVKLSGYDPANVQAPHQEGEGGQQVGGQGTSAVENNAF